MHFFQLRAVVALFLFCCLTHCVKPKIYQAELAARSAAEAREKVLEKELSDRKNETLNLTEQVGQYAKTIGFQEKEIEDLRVQITSANRQMGESTTKLLAEKNTLERNLSDANTTIEKQKNALNTLKTAQMRREEDLAGLSTVLGRAYEAQAPNDVVVGREGETLLLTLPDKLLFEPSGMQIAASGKALLQPLADFLAARPSLDIDVVAYTDNALPPKEKSLKDTWDWSLQRATNVVRYLIREFNVNANQLTPVGRGEFYPITSNETAEGRQKNRRTVIVVRPVLPAVPKVE